MPLAFRSIDSLLAEAKASEDPSLAARCVVAACAQAATSIHWTDILDGMPPTLSDADRLAVVAAAIAAADALADVTTRVKAAVVQARSLSDEVSARATLRTAEEIVSTAAQSDDPRASEWCVVAQGFRDALNDGDEARRTLERGWDLAWSARDVAGLGRIAVGWAEVLDREEAIERLSRIEGAALEWGGLSRILYWWRRLHDADETWRVRNVALERTTRFDEALDLARYWSRYAGEIADVDDVDTALAKAEALAQTGQEWLALAEVALEMEPSRSLTRRALKQAAASATDVETRARIASAYADWLHDEVASVAVGPRGVRPELLRENVGGSPSALFDALRTRITPEQLRGIAEADNGYGDGEEQHLAALVEICSSGLVPYELPWHPREVLALTRWTEGEHVDHVARALSCTLLCLAAPEDELSYTGPLLVESALALGPDLACGARELLAWLEANDPEGSEGSIAACLLCILRAAQGPNDLQLARDLQRMLQSDTRGLRDCIATSLRVELWASLIEAALALLHADVESRV